MRDLGVGRLPELLAALALLSAGLACSGGRSEAGVPAPSMDESGRSSLQGSWSLVSTDTTRPRPRFFLVVRIDRADGAVFRGRVTHYLAGDVGVDPAEFAPFEGRFVTDSVVRFSVASYRDIERAVLEFEAVHTGDTLVVRSMTVSGSNWVEEPGSWAFVRER